MAANYHRVWVRFTKSELKRRLYALQQEMSKKAGKKISRSKLIEGIVEQFLDTHVPSSDVLEE